MDKTQVYIGVYKNENRESLFFKKNEKCYYDLKTKNKVSSNDIDLDSLIPYNGIIKCKSNSKKNIIRLYDLDRMEKVSLNRVFIGNVYEIREQASTTSCEQSGEHLTIKCDTTCRTRLFQPNALLFALEQYVDMEYNDFFNLETGSIYENDTNLCCGSLYIPRTSKHIKPIKEVISLNDNVIEKRELLEKYREYVKR